MDNWSHIEKTAVDMIRGAGRYGVYLSHLGFEVAGVADWLESQVPRLRGAVSAMARAAAVELSRPDSQGTDREEH
jgi:hypothetical protein